MRSDEEILSYILRAKQEKAERQRIEAERQAEEHAHKQVFFQASRVVLVNGVLPTMERLQLLCERGNLRGPDRRHRRLLPAGIGARRHDVPLPDADQQPAGY